MFFALFVVSVIVVAFVVVALVVVVAVVVVVSAAAAGKGTTGIGYDRGLAQGQRLDCEKSPAAVLVVDALLTNI